VVARAARRAGAAALRSSSGGGSRATRTALMALAEAHEQHGCARVEREQFQAARSGCGRTQSGGADGARRRVGCGGAATVVLQASSGAGLC